MRLFGTLLAALATFPSLSWASPFTDIIAAMDEGDWAKVNLNRYVDVWTPFDQRPTGNDPGSIVRAWSSFAWDSTRQQLILWGGGHANYGGNEVYTWQSSTLEWTRASLPSAVQLIPGSTDGFFTVDGPMHSPIASHTYDNQEYLPGVDRFITFGGAAYNNGARFALIDGGVARTTGPYLWDPAKADPNKVGGLTGSQVDPAGHPGVAGGEMWQNRDRGAPAPDIMMKNTASDAVLEKGKDVVYFSGVLTNGTLGGLYKYTVNDIANPAADTWEQVGAGFNGLLGSDSGSGALDAGRHLFVRTSGLDFIYWDLNVVGLAIPHVFTPTVVGAGGSLAINNYGLEWDPIRGGFVLWMGNGDVWHLKPPDVLSADGWILEKAPDPDGATPLISDATQFTGVLGKWKYDATDDVFIGLSGDIDGNVWVYKPLGWRGLDDGGPDVIAAPEPGTVLILASGLGFLALRRIRKPLRS